VLYTAAAELGHAGAQAALGLAHLSGKYVPSDPLRAINFLETASAAGHAEAAFQLGLCHLEGKGIPVDYAKAAHYLLKAAERGHANATYNMGVLFYHGHGVVQDADEAMRFYAKAAEMGSASGQFRLGHAYATGQEQLPGDPEKALYWFNAAAEQGHVPAQVNLVRLLTSRAAPPEELERWRARLEEAARHGMAIAMTALAEMKWNIDRDAPAAIAMAHSAVELGDPLAEGLVQYLEAKNFNGVVR
jgi:TPR repeat protein